jgi:hypothetical protein
MFSPAAELGQFCPESAHTSRMVCSIRSRCRAVNAEWWCFVRNQMDMRDEDTVPASAYIAVFEHETKYA